MNTYRVKVIEEIRYHIDFEVEAESEKQAKDIIREDTIEGEITEEDMTYFEILSVDKL